MVHRIPGISDAFLRAARSLLQNIVSVAVVAGGAAVVTAGDATDAGTLGVVGGQAALAAVLSYVFNWAKPAWFPNIGEVKVRSGLTLVQNLVSGAIVAGGAAVVQVGGGDLKTLALAAGQAAFAAVVAALYNWKRPLGAVSQSSSV
ncbi:hypothetical protein [Nonomuraea recticatena]|uniref:Holin n=1 Tax=Nonomuraea recticatena TaxID=46178 RepID=A0ABN3T4J5_9ACTN